MRRRVRSAVQAAIHSALLVAILTASPHARAQARLEPVPGSPFIFTGGGSSQLPLASPDGQHLYVSSLGAGDIIVLDVALDAALTFQGRFPSAPPTAFIGGMAFSPGGDRLYAVARGVLDLHSVGSSGELSPPRSFPTHVPSGDPLNGVTYLPLAGGDFLYVNDNALPNTVSAWRIGPDGAPEFVAAYPTGGNGASASGSSLIAAPHVATFGSRLFALNAPPRGGTASGTIAVFDVGPDGALTAVTGSPFDLGTPSASIAVDPSGTVLYAGGNAGNVLKLRIAVDGALELLADAPIATMTGKPNGLAVDPSGRWLAFSATAGGRIAVVDTASLAPIESGVQADAFSVDSVMSIAAGLTFDAAGHLFVGHTGATPIVSAYRIVTDSPPVVTCVGTPENPAVLAADSTCAVTVDAVGGFAGACADGGGGLASCRLDGADSVSLRPGVRAIEVVATSPSSATASCTSYVNVVDVTPPTVSVSPWPPLLWPPNRQLVPIDLRARAWDSCAGELVPRCSAVSSEPDRAAGKTSPDILWSDGALWLRAEAATADSARIYTLTCQAVDAAGNVGNASATVRVMRDDRG
jgi:DNA-binding beta-propeller fold protein YncE